MVFRMLSGLFSILSSALLYLAGAIIFSKNEETLVAFIVALIFIQIIIFLVRLVFFKGENRLKFAMRSMRPTGFMARRMARSYKHTHDRKVISGNVARILSFGLILYMVNFNLMVAYVSIAFALFVGIIMLASFKNKFTDLITGAVLGVVAGLLASQFAPLIISSLGI